MDVVALRSRLEQGELSSETAMWGQNCSEMAVGFVLDCTRETSNQNCSTEQFKVLGDSLRSHSLTNSRALRDASSRGEVVLMVRPIRVAPTPSELP